MNEGTHDHPTTITAANTDVLERELNHAVRLTREKASQTDSDMPDGSTKWQPADDWTLLEGCSVEIHEGREFIDRGRVEAVTNDGCILWLALEGIRPRRLVEKLPGIELRIIPVHRFR